MGNWTRDMKSKENLNQTIFFNGQVVQKQRPRVEVTELEGVALCPFCLYQADVSKFVFSAKGGFHKGLGRCPRCKNMGQWRTLKRNWKISEFARWVYEYAASGFWQKVKYREFNEGLKRLGVLESFWTQYRALKGEGQDENETY